MLIVTAATIWGWILGLVLLAIVAFAVLVVVQLIIQPRMHGISRPRGLDELPEQRRKAS